MEGGARLDLVQLNRTGAHGVVPQHPDVVRRGSGAAAPRERPERDLEEAEPGPTVVPGGQSEVSSCSGRGIAPLTCAAGTVIGSFGLLLFTLTFHSCFIFTGLLHTFWIHMLPRSQTGGRSLMARSAMALVSNHLLVPPNRRASCTLGSGSPGRRCGNENTHTKCRTITSSSPPRSPHLRHKRIIFVALPSYVPQPSTHPSNNHTTPQAWEGGAGVTWNRVKIGILGAKSGFSGACGGHI